MTAVLLRGRQGVCRWSRQFSDVRGVFQGDENGRTDGGRPDRRWTRPLTRRFAGTRVALTPNGCRCDIDQPIGATNVPADGYSPCGRCRSQVRRGGFTRECCTPALWCGDSTLAACPVIGSLCIALSDDAGVRTMWLRAWGNLGASSRRSAPCRGKAGRPESCGTVSSEASRPAGVGRYS
jgi:hypothetical protein